MSKSQLCWKINWYFLFIVEVRFVSCTLVLKLGKSKRYTGWGVCNDLLFILSTTSFHLFLTMGDFIHSKDVSPYTITKFYLCRKRTALFSSGSNNNALFTFLFCTTNRIPEKNFIDILRIWKIFVTRWKKILKRMKCIVVFSLNLSLHLCIISTKIQWGRFCLYKYNFWIWWLPISSIRFFWIIISSKLITITTKKFLCMI